MIAHIIAAAAEAEGEAATAEKGEGTGYSAILVALLCTLAVAAYRYFSKSKDEEGSARVSSHVPLQRTPSSVGDNEYLSSTPPTKTINTTKKNTHNDI